MSRGMSNMYTLIIGINKYLDVGSYRTLHGCVTDGQSVVEYLKSRLFVPDGNIHCLYDSAATHAAIISEIEFFGRGNPRRGNGGDPILIYYAGHGGEGLYPSQWGYRQNEKIQVLIPYDCGIRNNVEICAIPDYTIQNLLKNIADRIGHNTTVIFDCCHSASGTRSADPSADSDCAIRGVQYRGRLPSHPIFGHPSSAGRTRGIQVAPSYINGGLKSHVLLAACNAREFARELQKRGVFTTALLDALYKIDLNDMRNLTYRDLLKRIPQLSEQNPQCEGDFQDRFIFQLTQSLRTDPLFFGWVSITGEDLHIKGGQENRINKGDSLAIWRSAEDHTSRAPPVGRVKVATVLGPSDATAQNTLHFQPNAQIFVKVVK
ncbi:hypothetical protein HYPSUDRAFT_669500 [Hypholoma sublateritium FD-334 SS-4]|uniref:Peptidase C14 caspase domain-containing protein n=1 Tax=Hypholoma sublateritium (strain FD-334 SS-4) TaxID=945553 RepID=A0A0D2MF49_HYPSF|nr:hypothetical protein HYPSUDRAFT_669500 [Hypholoma sublateritium FD-334 SS-4]